MPKKILIVDDSSTVRMAAKILLGSDYTLVAAKNGAEGLDQARSERPDLILLDLIMPKMSGLEVCRQLRQEPGFEKLPILMLTTRGEPENIEAGYEAGCTEYLTKPFDGADLLSRIRDCLGEQSS